MRIVEVTETEFERWLPLREALWTRESADQLREDARRTLADPNQVAFLAILPDGQTAGFIEAGLYGDDGGRPRVHVEAWYVAPEFRRRGIGRGLLGHVEHWSLHRSIHLLTSDTNPDHPLSPAAHLGSDFRKLAELQIFVKTLKD